MELIYNGSVSCISQNRSISSCSKTNQLSSVFLVIILFLAIGEKVLTLIIRNYLSHCSRCIYHKTNKFKISNKSILAQWLNEEMYKAFKKIVNAGVGVTIEGSKNNKHFGMTIEEVQEIDNLIVPFGSEEMWEEFIRADIMDRYLSS